MDHPRAAEAFLDAVRRCLDVVREYPHIGRQLRRSQLRQFVIEGWRGVRLRSPEQVARLLAKTRASLRTSPS
ncbi:MAG: hypothetical protein M3P06_21180 [Acidobacteriota bacterium]|nr:hypothetical protein [Acidobacteriota bacterium]